MELLQSDVNVFFSAIHVQSFLCYTIHFLQNVLENSNKPCSNVHKELNLIYMQISTGKGSKLLLHLNL